MTYFSKLLGTPPFFLFQKHMEKVQECLQALDSLWQAIEKKEYSSTENLAKIVSQKEHEADRIKNDIRSSLSQRIFFPVHRSFFLEMLTTQDNLADIAEDIASYLAVRDLSIPEDMQTDFSLYKQKTLETVSLVKDIVYSMDSLLESSFGGGPAESAKEKIDRSLLLEHETDLLRQKVLKKIFSQADNMPQADFYLWMRIIEDINSITHSSEKLASKIGMILNLK